MDDIAKINKNQIVNLIKKKAMSKLKQTARGRSLLRKAEMAKHFSMINQCAKLRAMQRKGMFGATVPEPSASFCNDFFANCCGCCTGGGGGGGGVTTDCCSNVPETLLVTLSGGAGACSNSEVIFEYSSGQLWVPQGTSGLYTIGNCSGTYSYGFSCNPNNDSWTLSYFENNILQACIDVNWLPGEYQCDPFYMDSTTASTFQVNMTNPPCSCCPANPTFVSVEGL